VRDRAEDDERDARRQRELRDVEARLQHPLAAVDEQRDEGAEQLRRDQLVG
jgi:hypothetical protein